MASHICETFKGAEVSDSQEQRVEMWVLGLGHSGARGMVVQTLSHVRLEPHGLQPARLLCPRDFPGKNIGVGCHFLF